MNLRFYTDILFIILSWILMFTAYNGWGHKLINFLKLDLLKNDKLFIATWLGWSLSIGFFSILNLFFPITFIASTLFFTIGFIFFIKNNQIQFASLNFKKTILPAVFIILIAIIAMQLPYCYDTGLYHLNSIRWLNEYSHITGIGNLHHRFGFNQLFFVYVASLNFHPFLNNFAFHCANGFLFVLLGLQLMLSNKTQSFVLFASIFFIPMPIYWLASPSPDICSTVLQLTAFIYFIKILRDKNYALKTKSYVCFIAIITAVSTVIKLSNAAFSIGLAFTVFILIRTTKLKEKTKASYKKTTALIGILLMIWILRGYMATGHPLFPSNFGRINFDWTISQEALRIGAERIFCFARLRSYEFDSPLLKEYKWVKPWFENIVYDIEGNFEGLASVFFVFASLTFFLIWLFKTILKTLQKENHRILLILWFVELLSIFFWFTIAPDIRFANGLFIIFFITGLLLVKSVFPYLTLPTLVKAPIKFLSVACYAAFIFFYVASDLFYLTGIITLPKIPMSEKTTNSGLTVLTPNFKDQSWDSKIPATPEFNPKLSLRNNTIESGFKIVNP